MPHVFIKKTFARGCEDSKLVSPVHLYKNRMDPAAQQEFVEAATTHRRQCRATEKRDVGCNKGFLSRIPGAVVQRKNILICCLSWNDYAWNFIYCILYGRRTNCQLIGFWSKIFLLLPYSATVKSYACVQEQVHSQATNIHFWACRFGEYSPCRLADQIWMASEVYKRALK